MWQFMRMDNQKRKLANKDESSAKKRKMRALKVQFELNINTVESSWPGTVGHTDTPETSRCASTGTEWGPNYPHRWRKWLQHRVTRSQRKGYLQKHFSLKEFPEVFQGREKGNIFSADPNFESRRTIHRCTEKMCAVILGYTTKMKAMEARLPNLNEFLERNNTLIFKVSNILNVSCAILKSLYIYNHQKENFQYFDKDFKRFVTFVFWSGTLIPTVASIRIFLK